jgi:hypothetical protein
MHLTARKILLLLLSLFIAVLPLRTAYAGATVAKNGMELTAAMSGMPDCNMGMEAQAVNCPDHNGESTSLSDCCQDHCGSAVQLILSSELALAGSSVHIFHSIYSVSIPEPEPTREYRPPLTHS